MQKYLCDVCGREMNGKSESWGHVSVRDESDGGGNDWPGECATFDVCNDCRNRILAHALNIGAMTKPEVANKNGFAQFYRGLLLGSLADTMA